METNRDDFVIAIRSAFLKKGTQQRFSLIALIFVSILFLVLGSFNFKAVDYIKKTLKEIVYRASFIASGPEHVIKKNYSIISSHFELYDKKKKDAAELNSLRSKDLSQKILTLENIKYKKLIDDYLIKENETYAKVLIDKQSPFLRSVIINKGSKNKIKLGMIILDQNYLVGKVVEVNYFTSRVLLISDINSKIPVSLQPGDIQAIMSGKGAQSGVLQYTKDKNLINNDKEILVLTSGAGGLFKSGIPIGIIKKEENILDKNEKIVNFYKDFSQLKYVKVVSFTKEKLTDESSKIATQELDNEIDKINQAKETINILLKQKKIAEEIRIEIEEEINFLKDQNIKLQNKLLSAENAINQNKRIIEEAQFIKWNDLYGKECKKTFYNNLHKVGTDEYKNCVLSKGLLNN